ncbi:3TM-type holin [Methylobacterium sp. WL8]|uniref:3TM-type holin n=1 Tax=Methylobacterium sp. WL8 TaxID=2603899 RepID=UPI0011C7821F|nr:3TM-type holin [Methylobacterium sp. WL8]TXN78278.1 hypothetical protein FV234_22960 [Methylobacterium sp. WL8]
MAAGLLAGLAAAPAAIEAISNIIGRFVPDPAQQAQASLELQKVLAERESSAAMAAAEIAKAQAATNTAEAQNPSMFVGGWRPFVGWVCGIGLLYATLGQPIVAWATGIAGAALAIAFPPPPVPPSEVLMTLLTGMLGIAGLRTYDKVKGVAAPSIAPKA